MQFRGEEWCLPADPADFRIPQAPRVIFKWGGLALYFNPFSFPDGGRKDMICGEKG